MVDCRWRNLIPILDLIVSHLDDAADTLVLASETLDSIHGLSKRFRRSDLEAGPAESRARAGHILRYMDISIHRSVDLVAALDEPPGRRRYYSDDRFFPKYSRGGHLLEAKNHLEETISSRPCEEAIRFIAKTTDVDTLAAMEDAVQKSADVLSRAIAKMKSVTWYVTAFHHILSSKPEENCFVAGSHACEAANDTDTVRGILKDLLQFLKNQPPVVRDSFGYGLTIHNAFWPASTNKRIKIPEGRVCVILGNGLDTIRYLRVHSGAKIKVACYMDVQPGSQTRSVDLWGTPDQISRAEQLINDLLTEADAGIRRHIPYVPPLDSSTQKYMFSNEEVDVIIGDFEETMRYLHVQSGAQIRILRTPDSQKELVTISGTHDQIRRAKRLINVVLLLDSLGISRNFSRPSSVAEFFQMQLTNFQACLVIGKGGKTLQSLQAQSGARIQVVPLKMPPPTVSTERTLYIDGTADQIEIAKQLITEVTSEHGLHPDTWDPLKWFLEEEQLTD